MPHFIFYLWPHWLKTFEIEPSALFWKIKMKCQVEAMAHSLFEWGDRCLFHMLFHFLHFHFCPHSSSHRLNKLCELYAKVLGSQEALQVRLLLNPFPKRERDLALSISRALELIFSLLYACFVVYCVERSKSWDQGKVEDEVHPSSWLAGNSQRRVLMWCLSPSDAERTEGCPSDIL